MYIYCDLSREQIEQYAIVLFEENIPKVPSANIRRDPTLKNIIRDFPSTD
jgi:hypothetical protein